MRTFAVFVLHGIAAALPTFISHSSRRDLARAIAFAIQQPADVDVNEIVVRPIEQSS
ncbi:MAG: hypothetical protein V7K47_25555 [Nostoc sp.]